MMDDNWLDASIIILCPTRGRPKNMQRLVDSLIDTTDEHGRLTLVFRMDNDDEESWQYSMELQKEAPFQIIRATGERVIMSQLPNDAWDAYRRQRIPNPLRGWSTIALLGADDIVFRTDGWDEMVRGAFKEHPHGIALVYGDDGLQGKRLATHPFLSYRWIEAVGYVTPPYFVSDCADTWLMEMAEKIGKAVFLPRMLIEHMHPLAGKGGWDKTHQERLQRHEAEHPQEEFAKRQGERLEDAMKLRRELVAWSHC